MQSPEYYNILEISPDASAEVIRAAYRSLSKKYHPDNSPDSGEVRYFKRVQEAWEILSDPEKRRQYDAQLGRAGRSSEDRERHGRDDAESTTSQLPPDLTVMKVGGASSFLTISEHFKRNWKEAAGCDLSGMTFDGVSFRGATLTGENWTAHPSLAAISATPISPTAPPAAVTFMAPDSAVLILKEPCSRAQTCRTPCFCRYIFYREARTKTWVSGSPVWTPPSTPLTHQSRPARRW